MLLVIQVAFRHPILAEAERLGAAPEAPSTTARMAALTAQPRVTYSPISLIDSFR
jgi:hypothetical protein